MSKPEVFVEVWWNGGVERPLLCIGSRRENYFTSISMFLETSRMPDGNLPRNAPATSNRLVYEAIDNFAVWANQQEAAPYTFDVDKQRSYREIRQAQQAYFWRREQETAQQRARRLCVETCGPMYAENVQAGHCFYFTNNRGQRFIIDPINKNTVWLSEGKPIGLCVYFSDNHVQNNRFDWATAVYLHLKLDSSKWFDTANEYYNLRAAAWSPAYYSDSEWMLTIGNHTPQPPKGEYQWAI